MGGRLTRAMGMSMEAWCVAWAGAPMTRRMASVGPAGSGTVVVPSRVVIEIWLPFAAAASVVDVLVGPTLVVVVVVAPTPVVVVTAGDVVVVVAAAVVVVLPKSVVVVLPGR